MHPARNAPGTLQKPGAEIHRQAGRVLEDRAHLPAAEERVRDGPFVHVFPALPNRQLVDERGRQHVRRVGRRDHLVAIGLERGDHALQPAPGHGVPLGVVGRARDRLRQRVRHQPVDAVRESLLELHLQRVVVRRPVVLVEALQVAAVLREGPQRLGHRRRTAGHLIDPTRIWQRHAVQAGHVGGEFVVERLTHRQVDSGRCAFSGSMLDGSRRPALPT